MYRNFIDYLVDGYFSKYYGFDCHDYMNLQQFFIYMGQKDRVYDMYDHRIKMIGLTILLVIGIVLIISGIVDKRRGK